MVRTLLKLPANPQAEPPMHWRLPSPTATLVRMRCNERIAAEPGERATALSYTASSVPAEAFPLPPHESTPNPDEPQTGWRDGYTLPRNRTQEPDFQKVSFAFGLLFNNSPNVSFHPPEYIALLYKYQKQILNRLARRFVFKTGVVKFA